MRLAYSLDGGSTWTGLNGNQASTTWSGDYTVTVNWGDGSAVDSFYSSSASIGTRNHLYPSAHTGSQTVTVSVTDAPPTAPTPNDCVSEL